MCFYKYINSKAHSVDFIFKNLRFGIKAIYLIVTV